MAILPGTRIRDNGVFGTITDNPLTAGAVTFNSANLALLSAVAGNHALVTLDPLREHGAPEIVMVTAHTAAATVATIQRGMFGTVARSHPQGSLWVHAAADNDFREVVTSGTRPTDQYEGQPIYETDTDRLVSFTGSVWQQEGLFFDPPSCRVFHNTTQTIPDATETVVVFNSERWDTDSMHSTVSQTDRITINTAGLYLVTFNGAVTDSTDYVQSYVNFRLNDSIYILYHNLTGNGATLFFPLISASTVYKFAVGDFINVRIYHDNTANAARNLRSTGNWSPEFSATWIGRGN